MGLDDLPVPEHKDSPKNTPAEKQEAVTKAGDVKQAITKLWPKMKNDRYGSRHLDINVPGKGTIRLFSQNGYSISARIQSTGQMYTFGHEGKYFSLDDIPNSSNDAYNGGGTRIYSYDPLKNPPKVGGVANGAKLYTNRAKAFLTWVAPYI